MQGVDSVMAVLAINIGEVQLQAVISSRLCRSGSLAPPWSGQRRKSAHSPG